MDQKQLAATDPHQYDSPDLDWRIAGAEDNASRRAFREAFEAVIEPDSFRSKKILDIGSGVGQLFNWLRNKGAEAVVGIDPSKRNIAASIELYPWATSIQATLSEFAASGTDSGFDVAIACMVFEHIEDLGAAFRDIYSLVKEGGEFYLIIGDKDIHTLDDASIRGPNFLSVEILRDLGDGTVETKTIRKGETSETVMYDIFRPLNHVLDAAKENGFKLRMQKTLYGPLFYEPSERTHAWCHVLVFKK